MLLFFIASVCGLVSIASPLSILSMLSSLKDPLVYPQLVVVPLNCQPLSVLVKWQQGTCLEVSVRLELPVQVRWSIVKADSHVEIVPQML